MAKMTTVQTILSTAVSQGWPLHQIDVKNSFLHDNVKEDIFMAPPTGIVSSPSRKYIS